jgi:hypothetical protein
MAGAGVAGGGLVISAAGDFGSGVGVGGVTVGAETGLAGVTAGSGTDVGGVSVGGLITCGATVT